MVGGDAVQLLPGREPVLREIARHALVERRLPDGHGNDPVARRGALGKLGDALQHVGDGGAAGERRQRILQALAVHMGMATDQARNHQLAAGVDAAGAGPGKSVDLRVVSDREEAAVRDGDG